MSLDSESNLIVGEHPHERKRISDELLFSYLSSSNFIQLYLQLINYLKKLDEIYLQIHYNNHVENTDKDEDLVSLIRLNYSEETRENPLDEFDEQRKKIQSYKSFLDDIYQNNRQSAEEFESRVQGIYKRLPSQSNQSVISAESSPQFLLDNSSHTQWNFFAAEFNQLFDQLLRKLLNSLHSNESKSFSPFLGGLFGNRQLKENKGKSLSQYLYLIFCAIRSPELVMFSRAIFLIRLFSVGFLLFSIYYVSTTTIRFHFNANYFDNRVKFNDVFIIYGMYPPTTLSFPFMNKIYLYSDQTEYAAVSLQIVHPPRNMATGNDPDVDDYVTDQSTFYLKILSSSILRQKDGNKMIIDGKDYYLQFFQEVDNSDIYFLSVDTTPCPFQFIYDLPPIIHPNDPKIFEKKFIYYGRNSLIGLKYDIFLNKEGTERTSFYLSGEAGSDPFFYPLKFPQVVSSSSLPLPSLVSSSSSSSISFQQDNQFSSKKRLPKFPKDFSEQKVQRFYLKKFLFLFY